MYIYICIYIYILENRPHAAEKACECGWANPPARCGTPIRAAGTARLHKHTVLGATCAGAGARCPRRVLVLGRRGEKQPRARVARLTSARATEQVVAADVFLAHKGPSQRASVRASPVHRAWCRVVSGDSAQSASNSVCGAGVRGACVGGGRTA